MPQTRRQQALPRLVRQMTGLLLFGVLLQTASLLAPAPATPARESPDEDPAQPTSITQTLFIGSTTGPAGARLSVPIRLEATVDCTAVLLRLEFDPALLSNPEVVPGGLLGPDHTVLNNSPEPGRLNILAADLENLRPLLQRQGVLAEIVFETSPASPTACCDVVLTTAGLPDLPASGMLGSDSTNIVHTVIPGQVCLEQTTPARYWVLY